MQRRSSTLWAVFFLVVSGGMGILAGYGALRLWHDHQQLADAGPPPAAPRAAPTPPAQPATSTPPSTQPSAQPAATPPARRSPATDKKPPARRSGAGRRSAEPPPTLVMQPQPEPPAGEPQPTPGATMPAATSPATSLKEPPQVFVDFDLTKNRQQQTFDAASKELHITALEGCDTDYEIKTDSIVIKAPRDIVVDVSWENLPNGKRRITLEPTVKTDAGKKMPFTVRNMDNIKRQATQTGEQSTAALAALKQEQQYLNDYIKSASRRSVAQDDAARARLDQLKKLIPLADTQLKSLQADFALATKMADLAESLNEKCRILLGDTDVPLKPAADVTPPPRRGNK